MFGPDRPEEILANDGLPLPPRRMRCNQEMCPMWDGDNCPCDTFGLSRDSLPTDGVFTVEKLT
jgi:hypothetical protein